MSDFSEKKKEPPAVGYDGNQPAPTRSQDSELLEEGRKSSDGVDEREEKTPASSSLNGKNTDRGRSRLDWFYGLLPYNIAAGPLGTFVQLYILQLYGADLGKIYVGLVITAFNAVTIPASMIWGFATDRIHRRKPVVALSFIAIAVNIVAFLFANNLFAIGLLYSLFSLLSAASVTPLNLLIMETSTKSKWASAFARFSMFSSIGVTVGLLLSLFWVALLPLQWLVIPLAILSVVSGLLAFVLIQEPNFVFEREVMVMHKKSFHTRLHGLPLIFLHLPRGSDFRRVFKGLRFELTSYTPILYVSVFAFNLGSSIFNTSLIPSMYANSFPQSQVFLMIFITLVVQIFSFHYVAPYIEKRPLIRTAVGSLVIRALCYSLLGVFAFLFTGLEYTAPILVLYPISSGFAYAVYYTVSNTLVFNALGQSGHRSPGSSLGVYSALVGVATMIGSLVSGFISFYTDFYFTFTVAGFCIAGSALFTALLERIGSKQEKKKGEEITTSA